MAGDRSVCTALLPASPVIRTRYHRADDNITLLSPTLDSRNRQHQIPLCRSNVHLVAKDTSVQAHTRHTCEVRRQISISYSHPQYGIHLRTSIPTGGRTDLTPTNPSNTPIQTTNQILPDIQPGASTTHLMIRLGGNPKQKYSRTTRTQSLRNRMIIRLPGNPLERLKSISKNAEICARTHGLPLLLQKVSNLHLGSLRGKSQRRGLTITFRMVSQTRHPSAIPLCIRWRIFSDTWIRRARICNGWMDMWRKVREHYHSSIGMS